MRGVRFRLAATLLGLVAVSVAAIGLGTYAFVETQLRRTLLDESIDQAQFDLSVLLPGRLPPNANAEQFAASGLPEAFRLRGDAGLLVDFGDGDPYADPTSLLSLLDALPASLRADVDGGRIGYAWLQAGDGIGPSRQVLVVGGRQGDSPAIHLVVDAGPLEATLGQLRLGLVLAGIVALVVALATAGFVARRILRPIETGSRAAALIAAGDLAARVPVEGRDELAAWAAEFNRMAASLEVTVASLEAAQQQNRRFVADVSHELRTPITALVAEASLIESSLDRLPPDARRAGELLVTDVRRLRLLVDDLMELSRFDAAAEVPSLEPVDLGRIVASTAAARLPGARVAIPGRPVVVAAEVRRLDRIVGNLLDNARIHAPGSPVELTVDEADGVARVVVADRGPGVGEDALPHLFDRFYKADPSRRTAEAPSSGLGLAIAAEHARLLGGTLTAAARPGGGLTFSLSLPVTRSLPDGDGADTTAPQASTVSTPTNSRSAR